MIRVWSIVVLAGLMQPSCGYANMPREKDTRLAKAEIETMVLDFEDRVHKDAKSQFYRLRVDRATTRLRIKIHAKQWRSLTATLREPGSTVDTNLQLNRTVTIESPKSGEWRIFVKSTTNRHTAFTLTAGLTGGQPVSLIDLQARYETKAKVQPKLIARHLDSNQKIEGRWYCQGERSSVVRRQRTFRDDGKDGDNGASDGSFEINPLTSPDTDRPGIYLLAFKYQTETTSAGEPVWRYIRYSFKVGDHFHRGMSLTEMLNYLETGLGTDTK